MKVGADISTWQGVVDFTKAYTALDFIIPRTGFALTTDNKFRINTKNALAFKVDVPAVYHFSYALCEGDAVKEAEYAIAECEIVGLPKSTIIFYDFEYDSVNYAKKKGIKIGPKEINNFTTAFCEACLAKGYRTGIYLNLDYYRNYYYLTVINNPNYVIWLADWTGGPDHPCYIHQYTSKGSVPGINGNVDMNYIYEETHAEGKVPDSETQLYEMALEVIAGKWGTGPDRKIKLENAGWSYEKVQTAVNKILNGEAVTENDSKNNADGAASAFAESKLGRYKCTDNLYLRKAAGKNKYAVCLMPVGTDVYCCGYYTIVDDEIWLYVHSVPFRNNVVYTGFCCAKYLTKI